MDEIDTPKIGVQIAEDFTGKKYIICNRHSVFLRRVKTFKIKGTDVYQTKNYDKEIICVSFELFEIFVDQNETRFYKVKLGDEEVCLNKKDLIDFIQIERNYNRTYGKQLFETVSIVLREFEKKRRLTPKNMYPAVGVFLDNKDNLKLVYPRGKDFELYGINAYQKQTIKRWEKKGIDKSGELLMDFYEFAHLKTYSKNTMIMTLGHSLISCFFNVLRDDLDIFPDHYGIDPRKSVGKSTLFDYLYCICYGSELKNNDDIDSLPRLTEMLTANTFSLCADDIDYADEKITSYLKSSGTNMKAKERMMADQSLRLQETYRTFAGTANSEDFLSGEKNDAYRGRIVISKSWQQLERDFDLNHLELLKEKIRFGPIFGFYLLSKSIEFIESKKQGQASSREKLKSLLRENKKQLREYLERENIFLEDSRRLTIYALIYTGCQMWDYTFKTKDFTSPLLTEFLDFKNKTLFKEVIEGYEGANLQISIEDIFNFITFYEMNEQRLVIWYRREDDKEFPFITTDFINAYDKWAKDHNYEALNTLTRLSNMVSKILGNKLTVNTKYVHNRETEKTKLMWGIIFDFNALKKRLGIDRIDNNVENAGDVIEEGIVKLFSGEKYKELHSRLIEIFEENDFQPLEEANIIEILSVEGYKEAFLTEAFIIFIKNKILNINPKGYLTLMRE